MGVCVYAQRRFYTGSALVFSAWKSLNAYQPQLTASASGRGEAGRNLRMGY